MPPLFQINPSKVAPGHRVLAFPYEFNVDAMEGFRRCLESELDAGYSVLLVDFSAAENVEVDAILPFVQEVKLFREKGLYLGVFGLSPRLRKLFRVFGARDVLESSEDEESAALNLVAAGTARSDEVLPPAEPVATRMEFKVRIPSRHGFVHAMRPFLQGTLREVGFTQKFADDIELAFDEAVVNIIEHTYHNSPDREIDITVDIDIDMVRLIIEDDGEPYDPTQRPDVDMKEYLQKKKVGGLGLHLIRMLMDHIEYHASSGGGNVLTLEKWAN